MKPVSIVVVLINTETHKVAIIRVVAIIGACTLHIEIKHQQVMTYIHQLLNQEIYPHIILISNNVSTCSKILLLIIN